VIGHSNGGMLGVRHVVDHPQTPALVLLSAGRGGTRTVSGWKEGLFAGDRQEELTARARELVAAGRGRELMFMPGWWWVITAESFLDRIVTVPDTIALAPQIKCPVLAIRGDQEDPDRYPAEEFQRRAGGPCRVEIVTDCRHFYNGREDHVAEIVSGWMAATLALTEKRDEIPVTRYR
jgi:pimeloyl-ACP methyl ester carboxylesterase